MNRLAIAGIVVSTMGLIVQQSIGADFQFGSWQIGVASITGGLLAARTLVSLAGAPVAGTLSDRVGQRWGLLAISLIIGAIGIGIVPTTNIFALIVGTIASAIASGSIQSLTTALVGDLATGSAHGKNLGLFYTAGDLGSAIGPLVAYAVLPFTGLAVVYLGCAILMMGTALVVMPFTRLRKST